MKNKITLSLIPLYALLVIIVLAAAAGIVKTTLSASSGQFEGVPSLAIALVALYQVTLVIFASVTFWSVFTRKSIARWLSMSFILLLTVGLAYAKFFLPQGDGILPRAEYAEGLEDTGKTMETAIAIALYVVLALWALRLGFSEKYKALFSKTSSRSKRG